MEKSRFFLRLIMLFSFMIGGSSIRNVQAINPNSTDFGDETAAMDYSGDWFADIQEEIINSEYRITWQESVALEGFPAAYQAPNRAQNVRTFFTQNGISIIPRQWMDEEVGPPWQFNLGLIDQFSILTSSEPEVIENQITYQRGAIAESYRNSNEGLQLEVRMDQPLSNASSVGLRLSYAWSGTLAASLMDGNVAQFVDENGSGLRLGNISAHDSSNQTLPVEIILEGQTISIQVEDSEAIYPVLLKSIITGLPGDSSDWDLAGPVNSKFGFSVATAGDVNRDGYSDVIIGSPLYDEGQADEGAAFVVAGSSSGLRTDGFLWSKFADQVGAQFGYSVSTAGDVNLDGFADIIVGAPYYDHPESNEGGAWIYQGSWEGPHSAPDFFAQSNQEDAQLGWSVAFAGDVNNDLYSDVIIGAPGYSYGQTSEGWVMVWHGSIDGANEGDNGFPSNSDWFAEIDQVGAQLGFSVATAGDINADGYADVVVGASYYDELGGALTDNNGAVLAWYGSDSGVNMGNPGNIANAWMAIGNLHERLGYAVAGAGDVDGDGFTDVIAGAPDWEADWAYGGAAFLFRGSAEGLITGWSDVIYSMTDYQHLGSSVACAGDVNGDGFADVIVGGSGDITEAVFGKAEVYYGSPTNWKSQADWSSQGELSSSLFGNSVATAGDVNGDGFSDVIIGAPGSGSTAGTVYVFHGSADTPADSPNWSKRSNQEGAFFGFSVSSAGDVNADGFADVIVGAPNYDHDGKTDAGGAWIYVGSGTGLSVTPWDNAFGDQASAQFGFSVSSAGDVNGDGFSDVIIGAPTYDHGQTDEGRAYVFHGSFSGIPAVANRIKESNQTNAQFGYSVAGVGDIHGDGYCDVAVGAPYWSDAGGVWIYRGSESGVISVPDRYIRSEQEDSLFGYSVAGAGDVNGDSYSDLLVGSPYWEDDAGNEGRAWLYQGSSLGLQSSHSWHAESNSFDARMGWSVATAGDVNRDGYSDVIVSAPYYDDARGKVWVFLGSLAGLSPTHSWTKQSNELSAKYGFSVATAGDVNGDGYSDILIGAPGMTSSDGVNDEGLVRLYTGSASGLETTYFWTDAGGQTLSWYGISVAGVGDINGDTFADFVVGVKDYNEVYVNEGRACVYYGNGHSGTAVNLRQHDYGNYNLAILGRVETNNFRPRFFYRSPFGRTEMAAFMEFKTLGLNFNGHDLVWNGYFDDPIMGDDDSMFITGLQWGTAYHWRIRFDYLRSTTPWMPSSRWMTLAWNGPNEEDFRTAGVQIRLPLVFK